MLNFIFPLMWACHFWAHPLTVNEWVFVQTNDAPSPRSNSVLAADPKTGQLLLFGGVGNADSNLMSFNDTWKWDGNNWILLSPTTSPSPRSGATMAIDANSNSLLLFGGYNDAFLADTWTWDGNNWILLSPATSPSPRSGAVMALDPSDNSLLLFGGHNDNYLNDTWKWNGNNWVEFIVSPLSPSIRSDAVMAVNPTDGQLLLFGGSNGNNSLNDTWTWDGEKWQELAPETSPSPSTQATLEVDPNSNKLLLYKTSSNSNEKNESWKWDGNNWILQTPSTYGQSPRRLGAVMARDPLTNKLLLFGGRDPLDSKYSQITWLWNGSPTSLSNQTLGASQCPAPTSVSVAPNPACSGSTAILTVMGGLPGATFTWFDSPTGGNQVGTGSPFTTPTLSTTTTFYVEQVALVPATATFDFTGAMLTFTVPAGVTSVTIDAFGAQGGTGSNGPPGGTGGGAPGLGGQATGTLSVTPGQILNIFVGGAASGSLGGFNSNVAGSNGGSSTGGGGGGASDVRVGGSSLLDRVIVGGGGGGGGGSGCETNALGGTGGAGGGGNGGNGANSPTDGGVAGGGFGGMPNVGGPAGIGCAGFLGSPGVVSNGGNGQACCCFSNHTNPGGGGGGGGLVNGGGGGGGSAGTTGCSGNDKGAGGGGAGGTSDTSGVMGGTTMNGVRSGNGQIIISYQEPCIPSQRISATVTVNQTPTGTATPSSQTICSGSMTNIALSSDVDDTTFSWTVSQNGVIGASDGSGETISQTLTLTANSSGTATYTITPTAKGCEGAPITVVVTVSDCLTPVAGFTGIARENGFLTQTDLIHILSWQPSSNSSVVGYRIYENGVLIKEIPVQGPYTITLHNRQNRAYTYKLVSFDANNMESDPQYVYFSKSR